MIKLTSLYASILGIIYFYLSIRTIQNRRRTQSSLGTGNDLLLEKSIRAHANFSEYVPFLLILIMLMELNYAPSKLIHLCGTLLIIGRIFHSYGISQPKENFKWRITGMMMTFLVFCISIITNIIISSK